MKNVCGIILLLPALVISFVAMGQPGTYILNGSAVKNTCNCYTLTYESNFQSGSVWNAFKINLNNPFDFVFNVNMGCKDGDGADGVAFILQPISTSLGVSGEGMGFEGITPSIGISLDTYQNTNRNDPAFDHISIQANGVINHGADLAGPVQALPTNTNIEDCQWRTFRIIWDPATKLLSTFYGGYFRLQVTVDLVATVFNNDPMVYWGFSAATGGSNNLQQFCTALNPNFNATSPTTTSCFGTPITFSNTSESFAPVADFFWDFGDGTTSTLANPPPHLYAAPGQYEVRLAITGLDGCQSDTLKKIIVVGDYPIPQFDVYDTCSGFSPRIIENSTVNIGSISQWSWTLNGAPVSVSKQPVLTGLSPGVYQLELVSTSNYGCASVPLIKQFSVQTSPVISAAANDGCLNIPVSFTAQQIDNATNITQWNWSFGDGQTSPVQNPQYAYADPGSYTATVTATASNGCSAAVSSIPVFINQAIANAGNDTTAIQNFPMQMQGSGGVSYSWSPPIGLNDASVKNPVATLQDDVTYTLTVTTAEGCEDTDEIKITVFKGSAVYVPTGFTPNSDGLNELLRPYCVGIQKLEYFTVYNRWGEMIYTTKTIGAGWNGVYKGSSQASGTYVWMLKAVDFAGKIYQQKGTTTLIK